MSINIDAGSKFPNKLKAKLAKGLDKFIKSMLDNDKEFFQLAQDKKDKLRKQRSIDLKSFIQSQSGAIQRGNSNSCEAKDKLGKIAAKQSANVKQTPIPGTKKKSPLLKGKKKKPLPKTRSATPTSGGRSRPSSLAKFKLNQATKPAIATRSHYIQQIDPNNNTAKSKRNASQFANAQAGKRGTSLGDRAIVFTANGTPQYGDSYLDKNLNENLAANQSTSNAPIFEIPTKVEVGKAISSNPLQQQPRGNVAPKSDTTSNLIVLGAIATAITAVLFLFQHVLIFVELILQVSSVTSTVTNVAGSFVAILNNIGSLFGLGEGLLDPLSKTFDGILNNIFGKDKVDYVKHEFAKISSAFVAGQNLLNKVTGFNNSIGKVASDNANNTSKIGNAMKAMGMMASGDSWMREDNKVTSGVGKVGDKLQAVEGFASALADITNDIKTAKEQQDTLDKDYKEKEKEGKEGEAKATEKHEDKIIADADRLQEVVK